MATRYIGMTAVFPQVEGDAVIGAATGGTLAGSQYVQVVFDDSIFTGQEGKQRLLAALQVISDRIASAKVWPIASTS